MSNLQTPVVLIVFNRPDWTRVVFEQIRLARPPRLFVISDGPRPDHPEDKEASERTLAILDTIDWPCQVSVEIAGTNLGCGKRIASGLSWVFQQVDSAIILEDDCVADLSFFPFCQELLERYRSDSRILSISGTNYVGDWKGSASYFFSCHAAVWGWATWARAWRLFDFDIRAWQDPEVKKSIRARLRDETNFALRSKHYDEIAAGRNDVWSFQWGFAHLANQALTAVPAVNLVTNIGWGPDATHCKEPIESLMISSRSLAFPLKHPSKITGDRRYDKLMTQATWPQVSTPGLLRRTRIFASRLKRALLKRAKTRDGGVT